MLLISRKSIKGWYIVNWLILLSNNIVFTVVTPVPCYLLRKCIDILLTWVMSINLVHAWLLHMNTNLDFVSLIFILVTLLSVDVSSDSYICLDSDQYHLVSDSFAVLMGPWKMFMVLFLKSFWISKNYKVCIAFEYLVIHVAVIIQNMSEL